MSCIRLDIHSYTQLSRNITMYHYWYIFLFITLDPHFHSYITIHSDIYNFQYTWILTAHHLNYILTVLPYNVNWYTKLLIHLDPRNSRYVLTLTTHPEYFRSQRIIPIDIPTRFTLTFSTHNTYCSYHLIIYIYLHN